MLHGVSQAYPLRAVLGAGTLMEECRGDMSVSGWPRQQEDSRGWGEEKEGAPAAQTLWAWTVRYPTYSWRDLLPTQVVHGVGQTNVRVPMQKGKGAVEDEPNPGAVGAGLPLCSCPYSPTPRHT